MHSSFEPFLMAPSTRKFIQLSGSFFNKALKIVLSVSTFKKSKVEEFKNGKATPINAKRFIFRGFEDAELNVLEEMRIFEFTGFLIIEFVKIEQFTFKKEIINGKILKMIIFDMYH